MLRGDVRLLTLTGVGGIGKTRLALEIAAVLVETFPDGVWFVDLAPLAEPDLVLPAVATVLGLREHPSQPLHTTLVAALRSRRLLLVLDNCEHLVDTCARLSEEIVRAAPDVRILVTSREALRIAGEVAQLVPPLALPPRGSDRTVVELQQHEAVRLFIERARAVRPSFAVTGQNAVTLAKICWRLDGIPLAIELAAARVGVLSVGQIDARLDDRFRLLTGGNRTALPRQQTLWATVDWSYALLAAPERRLFDRLSVFAGGWTLEAAEAVCAGDGSWMTGRRSQEQGAAIMHESAPPITHDPSPLPPHDVLDLVTRLVDQSLVVVEDEPPGAPSTEPAPPDRQPFDKRGAGSPSPGGVRYRLLETLRQYGRERLAVSGEADGIHERHAVYYLALAEEAALHLLETEQLVWLDRLQAERDNLRAALQWSREEGDVQAVLRLMGALGFFWYLRGHVTDRAAWGELLAEAPGAEARTLARAKALLPAAVSATERGDLAKARALLEEGLSIGRELGDDGLVARTLRRLGLFAQLRGDEAGASRLFEEALEISRANGDRYGVAVSLHSLGQQAVRRGDYPTAHMLLGEALVTARQVGDRQIIGFTIEHLAVLAYREGDVAMAYHGMVDALAIYQELADQIGQGAIQNWLGRLAYLSGDYAASHAAYHAGLKLMKAVGRVDRCCKLLDGLACLAMAQGQPVRVLRLAGASAALSKPSFIEGDPHDREELARTVSIARQALGQAEADAAWAAGRAMTLEQAIAEALSPDAGRGAVAG